MSSLRRASTVIVARPKLATVNDAFNYEIMFVRRSMNSTFMKGAYVFPGGVSDASDSIANWPELNQRRTDYADRVCAVRELFEETGLLLAAAPLPPPTASSSSSARTSTGRYVESATVENSVQRRKAVHNDATQFRRLCDELRVVPNVAPLRPFAHWTTPKAESKRFNTLFFFAALKTVPAEKDLAADGGETTTLCWLSPCAALEQHQQRLIGLAPPTWYCLQQMLRYRNVEALLHELDDEAMPMEHILPQFHLTGEIPTILYPGDAEYSEEIDVDRQTPNSFIVAKPTDPNARRRLLMIKPDDDPDNKDFRLRKYEWRCNVPSLEQFPVNSKEYKAKL